MGTESYPFIAVQKIFAGNVLAYAPGDPVPEDNAHEQGYLDDGLVVPRADYRADDPAVVGQPLQRGDMPPHLVTDAPESPAPATDPEPATDPAPAEPEPATDPAPATDPEPATDPAPVTKTKTARTGSKAST